MTIQGVLEILEICNNCQPRKDKGVVSLSALFASTGDSLFRSMGPKKTANCNSSPIPAQLDSLQ